MDYTLFRIINGLADKFFILDKLMVFIAQYFQYFFAVALMALWFKKDTKEKVLANRKAAIFAMIVMLIAIGINHIIGSIYFGPRPYTMHPAHLLINRSVDPSFPSDHATFAFALAFSVLAVNKGFGRVLIVMANQ